MRSQHNNLSQEAAARARQEVRAGGIFKLIPSILIAAYCTSLSLRAIDGYVNKTEFMFRSKV